MPPIGQNEAKSAVLKALVKDSSAFRPCATHLLRVNSVAASGGTQRSVERHTRDQKRKYHETGCSPKYKESQVVQSRRGWGRVVSNERRAGTKTGDWQEWNRHPPRVSRDQKSDDIPVRLWQLCWHERLAQRSWNSEGRIEDP